MPRKDRDRRPGRDQGQPPGEPVGLGEEDYDWIRYLGEGKAGPAQAQPSAPRAAKPAARPADLPRRARGDSGQAPGPSRSDTATVARPARPAMPGPPASGDRWASGEWGADPGADFMAGPATDHGRPRPAGRGQRRPAQDDYGAPLYPGQERPIPKKEERTEPWLDSDVYAQPLYPPPGGAVPPAASGRAAPPDAERRARAERPVQADPADRRRMGGLRRAGSFARPGHREDANTAAQDERTGLFDRRRPGPGEVGDGTDPIERVDAFGSAGPARPGGAGPARPGGPRRTSGSGMPDLPDWPSAASARLGETTRLGGPAAAAGRPQADDRPGPGRPGAAGDVAGPRTERFGAPGDLAGPPRTERFGGAGDLAGPPRTERFGVAGDLAGPPRTERFGAPGDLAGPPRTERFGVPGDLGGPSRTERFGGPDDGPAWNDRSAAPVRPPGPGRPDVSGRPGLAGRPPWTDAPEEAPDQIRPASGLGSAGQPEWLTDGDSPVDRLLAKEAEKRRPTRRPGIGSGRADGPGRGAAKRRPATAKKRPPAGKGLTRTLRRLPRKVLFGGAAAIVILVALAVFLLVLPQAAHVISDPATLGGYAREDSPANAATAAQLRQKIVAGASGEVKSVVAAVYERKTGPGTATGPQILVFIGGNLTGGGSASGLISAFTARLHGSFTTSPGKLGGQAACAPGSNGGPAECAWADNDTFGVIVSATMNASGLADEMRLMRPLVEHVAH